MKKATLPCYEIYTRTDGTENHLGTTFAAKEARRIYRRQRSMGDCPRIRVDGQELTITAADELCR